ncbi:MAG TPA: YetF domain-containing protein [Micromonosporaceae bacterium]|nr:YetF domain-containing protein [Micromonosporaceae bacterium]
MIDWAALFAIRKAPLEIILRGSMIYLALYLMLRVLLKRETGTTGVTDLLVIVLIADAAQNGMADDYTTITEGLILVATIVGWAHLLDFLAYRFPWLSRLIQPRPLLLVEDGRIIRRHLRRELITEEELYSQLRQQGVDDVSQAHRVYMEADGQFSVITRQQRSTRRKKRQQGI